jgi:dolichol-phosphate mannosyltransferase
MDNITIIIAVLNEEETIGIVIDRIKEQLRLLSIPSEIIVVDNGSTDRTKEILSLKDIKIIEEKKKGKGEAIITGIKEATGNILLFIDGDNTYPVNSIPEMIHPIIRGDKDVVYGSRFLKNNIEMSFIRRLGNKIFSFLASKLYCNTTDLLTGMVAVKKDKIMNLNLSSRGFEIETEFYVKSIINDLQSLEIPISYKQRRNSKLNPLLDGVKILKILLKYKL